MSDAVILRSGPLEAVVDPAAGARITAFRYAGTDLFTPTERNYADPGKLGSGGCYPLVPWSNRIRDGELKFGADILHLPATEPGRRHAIHGHGLRRKWHGESSADTATLGFDHPAGEEGWPWGYTCRQTVSVSATEMRVALSMTNQGPTAMPVGLGLHPYFPARADTRVQFATESAWPPVEDGKFPTGPAAVPASVDRRNSGPIPRGLDQGFGGWDGQARIVWPDVGLALTLSAPPPLSHLIVFTPTDRDFFCLEPVSHAIDATNLSGRGVDGTGHRILEAGETLSAETVFTVEVL